MASAFNLGHKPLLFFTSFPGEGHTNPVLAIAAAMVRRGYDVAYLCSARFRDKIEEAGAEFFEMPWAGGFMSPEAAASLAPMSMGLARFAMQQACVFYKSLPARVQAVGETLERLRARDRQRQIIVVEDLVNMGTMPFVYGRPLPAGFDSLPRTIGISPVPLMVQSQDTAPFMLGLPPDSTESGRLRNRALNQLADEGPMKPLADAWAEALAACGCTVAPTGSPLNAWYTAHDVSLMLCSPCLEYPLSDLPATVRFAGCLPRRGVGGGLEYPSWWPEVVGKAGKTVVFVAQGTVSTDWRELVVPTLEALADRADTLVVAALGAPGARLGGVAVPANARVADYLPYDAVLPWADVLVSNAGYGSLAHAVMNGVPAVFAGESEDKLEVAMRAERAGFAVNLRTQTPAPAQVCDAVARVLADGRYARRAAELRRENEAMDCLGCVERHIERLTEGGEARGER